MAIPIVSQVPGVNPSVYLIACVSMPGIYKIGMSANVNGRWIDIRAQYPAHRFRVIHSIAYPHARALEREVHKYFAHGALGREWFYLTPHDVEKFKTMTADQFMARQLSLFERITPQERPE